MKKNVLILLWLTCISIPVLSQEYQEPIEPLRGNEKELLATLEKNKTGTGRVHALLKLCDYYIIRPGYDQVNPTKALQYAKEALELSKSLNYARGRRESLGFLGRCYAGSKDIAGAKQILQQLTDTSRIHVLTYLSEHYWQNSKLPANLDTALVYADEIIHIAAAAGIPRLKATGYINRAIIYYFKGDLVKSEENYAAILALHPTIIGRQYIYGQLIALCYNKGEYEKVTRYAIEAEKVIKEEGETEFSGLIYQNTGTSYNVLKQYDKAVIYYYKAYHAAKKIKHNSLFWASVKELSLVLYKLNRNNEALALVKQAAQDMPPKNKEAIFFMNKSMGQCYTWTGDPVPAEKHYLAALEAAKGGIHHAAAYEYLVSYYIYMNQFAKAKLYLDTAWAGYNPKYPKSTVSWLHKHNYKADSALGNYESAMQHLRQAKQIDDSVMRVSTTKQMQELQVKYDTEKKDADLKLKDQDILLLTRQSELQQKDFDQARLRMQFDSTSKEQALLLISSQAAQKDKDLLLKQSDIGLLEKDALLKQSRLHQANLVQNVTFAGIGLLAIILLLLYNQYRTKQRRNKEISRKNEKLEQLVNEKEWLLKEIHHRVKNNLQTVVSLLESQSSYLEKDALQAVQSSQHRVYAMSLIHQKLYQENNMASINMAVYLPELVEYLADSFAVRQHIRFRLDIAPISLDVSQAVPIGLILNEAITNAIKYAFPQEGRNEIAISMQQDNDKQITLTIADNGIGLPPDFRNTKTSSLGVRLMNGLTGDIGGQFSIESNNGTSISIQFPRDFVIEQIKNNVSSPALPVES